MTRTERILADNMPWLEDKWNQAWEEKAQGKNEIVSEWFFDAATDRQLERIDREGIDFASNLPTKGQASDIIGLFEQADDWDLKILRYFKISTKEMNQTKAAYMVYRLFLEPDNVYAWENRPASAEQKRFYRYFNIPLPRNLTEVSASKFIKEQSRQLKKEGDTKIDNWYAIEGLLMDVNDPFNREDYGIKRVSNAVLQQAIDELKKEGYRVVDLEDNIDHLMKMIVKIKPSIRNAS